MDKARSFYEKYGFWTLVIGRFIPFGVRNCIFMTTGMSRFSFSRFMLMDAVACSLWVTISFYSFYTLGQNYQMIWHYLKTFNLLLFAAFSVTVISMICYKSRKKRNLLILETQSKDGA
jgi:membrane protein DedA with SNARE-associated domain